MIPSHVRAIFFDAVGTLIFPDPPAAEVYAAVGRRFGSRQSLETIASRFRAAFRREEEVDLHNALRTDEDREERRWRAIVAVVLDDVADGESCFRELFTHFACPEAWRCAPDAGTALGALARRGYRLGMASNYDSRLRPVVAGKPELRPLQQLVISSEAGWRKPGRSFFDAVVSAAGAPAAEVLFVGDDPANDYDGAREAGLQAVLLDPTGPASASVRQVSDLLAPRP